MMLAGSLAAQEARVDPDLNPAVITTLDKMGSYLRTIRAFQVKAHITREEVLEDGEKITFAGTADMVADRPSFMRMDVNSDRQSRLYLFDGKTFTVWAPRQKYYAQVAAPGNIKDLLMKLEDKHNLELPLLDLFRWGDGDLGNLTSARDMGPSVIEGVSTQHYALRQNGLDWQIWIQNGDYPLPRKVVLTTTTDDSKPQYTAVYDWNLAPSFNSESFVFVAPQDAKKISMEEVPSARATEQKSSARTDN
jgi:hypothetical protein